jgi:hypothetical protein
MATRSILNSFFCLALLFARTCCVQGVCSVHFNACQDALEAAEDHQHGHVHSFTQDNFAKFVYLTEKSGIEKVQDQNKVKWLHYDKLDIGLQNVFNGAIQELGLAICTHCERGFNLHDLFLHKNTEYIRKFCADVQIMKNVCIPAVNVAYTAVFSNALDVDELKANIQQLTAERIKVLPDFAGRQIVTEVKLGDEEIYECLSSDLEEYDATLGWKCAMVKVSITGKDMYDLINGGSINKKIRESVSTLINEEHFDTLLSPG